MATALDRLSANIEDPGEYMVRECRLVLSVVLYEAAIWAQMMAAVRFVGTRLDCKDSWL